MGCELLTLTQTPAISFTGSVRTGKTIASLAVANSKKYQLEMGGKNAAVTIADANLEQAVNLTIQGAFKSAGQKCTATSRAIVHKDVYDNFRTQLGEKTRALKVVPGDDAYAY